MNEVNGEMNECTQVSLQGSGSGGRLGGAADMCSHDWVVSVGRGVPKVLLIPGKNPRHQRSRLGKLRGARPSLRGPDRDEDGCQEPRNWPLAPRKPGLGGPRTRAEGQQHLSIRRADNPDTRLGRKCCPLAAGEGGALSVGKKGAPTPGRLRYTLSLLLAPPRTPGLSP